MLKATLAAIPEIEQHSPTRKFRSFARNVSLALGGVRNAGTWGGGHPFDLQLRRLPPGAAVCPFHAHLAQWELFIVHAGAGTVRTREGLHAVKTGDVFIHPPGEPHQLINSGTTDLEVFIVADNPPLDGAYYPDSDKWALTSPKLFFRLTETDYFAGEDAASADAATPIARPTPMPTPRVATTFAQRKIHPDDLPWDPWSSPKGKYRATSKELSMALGALRNTPTGLGGHPFDLELARLAPGLSGCPFHRHSSQWELYVILSGTGTVRANDETGIVTGGDVVLHPAGEAHQLTNTGDVDLDYYLIADNPPDDWWQYPDSNKWGFRSPRKIFRATDADYWDGEE